jgi:uncharacterized membrane protein
MFTVKAAYSGDVEFSSGIEKVRDFFADLTNFVELMPGIASIHIDAKGIAHWKIRAELPLIGSMTENFSVELTEKSDDRIEWFPARNETKNLLRLSAEFFEKAKDRTLIHITQMVELRRRSARDLHLLAGLAGETLISNEMSRKVSEMIRIFLDKAKLKLEGK